MSQDQKIEPRKLKGFRDFLPHQAKQKYKIIDIIKHYALKAAFLPIETPALEYADVLLGSGGEDCDKEVYTFLDHGNRKVALRYDLTVPFARFVAEHYGELTFPFKRLHIGDVWRGEKPQKGRYRQFCQADLDIVGVDSMLADIEILQCVCSILNEIIPCSFTVKIGNRLILSSIIKTVLKNGHISTEIPVLIELDKLEKIGEDAVKENIIKLGYNQKDVEHLLSLINNTQRKEEEYLYQVQELLSYQDAQDEFKRYSETLYLFKQLLKDYSNVHIVANLGLARGLGYYTGIVFEININQLVGFGAISAGGRYNKLVSRFSKVELPGVGGSIGVDRLLSALEELNTLISEEDRVSFFIAIATEDATNYAFNILNSIRKMGFVADIALKNSHLSAQFKYADKNNFSYVVTVGEEELKSNSVSLKNMRTKEQQKNLDLDSFFNQISQMQK